ncbi:MAG: hypothetical protein ACI9HA_002017, partial [Dinoroseobacter sp.]
MKKTTLPLLLTALLAAQFGYGLTSDRDQPISIE